MQQKMNRIKQLVFVALAIQLAVVILLQLIFKLNILPGILVLIAEALIAVYLLEFFQSANEEESIGLEKYLGGSYADAYLVGGVGMMNYDEWCVNNTRDNIALNEISDVMVVHGDASALQPLANTFDVIIANINRNILLQDLDKYVASLRIGGTIYMSGFYTEDVLSLVEKGTMLGLSLVDVKQRDNWAAPRIFAKMARMPVPHPRR